MSCLAIYAPPVVDISDFPAVLPFPRRSPHLHEESPALVRARLLYENRCCPDCHSVAVDPIELNDATLNWQGRLIPGTATVVAFHCNRCYHEWPARS